MTAITLISAYRQLSPAEKTFVDNYVKSLEADAERTGQRISNALYVAVGPDVLSKSRGMFDKPMVRAAIAERVNEVALASELSVRKVIKELTSVAFSSLGDFMKFDEFGVPSYDFSKATPDQLAALKNWEHEENIRIGRKIKFATHDKLKAIEMLARFMGLLEQDNPHWRADNKRPDVPEITQDATVGEAADLYSRMING